MSTVPLLSIENLSVEFRTRHGVVHALENVNLNVAHQEIVGIVGESGSGKSVLSLAVMRILDPAGRITSGRAVFGGLDLVGASEQDLADIRGRELAMIFQNPRSALNPIRKVGQQLRDVLLRHTTTRHDQLTSRAIECLSLVRISDPARRMQAYPAELSGGQCQRVMIAMALAAEPSLLIADEPTTGLDVTTQAVVVDLIKDLVQKKRMSALFITHDLALASQLCDRIAVMHAGHVVEVAPTAELFRAPRHPYTQQLIAAMPHHCQTVSELGAIPGNLPDLRAATLPPCRFSQRCIRHADACDTAQIPLALISSEHQVACRFPL